MVVFAVIRPLLVVMNTLLVSKASFAVSSSVPDDESAGYKVSAKTCHLRYPQTQVPSPFLIQCPNVGLHLPSFLFIVELLLTPLTTYVLC